MATNESILVKRVNHDYKFVCGSKKRCFRIEKIDQKTLYPKYRIKRDTVTILASSTLAELGPAQLGLFLLFNVTDQATNL